MQCAINQRGFYIVEMNSAGITKKSEDKTKAMRFDEELAREMVEVRLMSATMKPADIQHN